MADMLIRDQDPANIAHGDTLGEDKHSTSVLITSFPIHSMVANGNHLKMR